jgi:uncharacterized protein
MKAVFADTFFYLVLLNPRDSAHKLAVAASDELTFPIVTTEFVLLEVADALAAPTEKTKFLNLLRSLREDSAATIISVSSELLGRGIEFYGHRADKDWPLTDCISFIVMNHHQITDALTGDAHFAQAGFRALLTDQ